MLIRSIFKTGLILLPLLGGCVYTVDVNQGNIVTQEMVDQLKPGMTQRQVAFILGTPLLTDPFHDQRWDYIYSSEPGGGERVQRNLTVAFEQGELVGLQGDFHPGDQPAVDISKDVTVNIPRIERDKTLWEKIKGLFVSDD